MIEHDSIVGPFTAMNISLATPGKTMSAVAQRHLWLSRQTNQPAL
jgi:hypothetical protein